MQKTINQRWKIADKLENIKNHSSRHLSSGHIDRRTFLTCTGVSLLAVLVPSCAEHGSDTLTEALIQETEFKQFFDVIFPASILGLEQYSQPALKRIQHLKNKEAMLVAALYQRFKHQLWLKNLFSKQVYTADIGGECLADILQSGAVDESNEALDIIYMEVIKLDGFSSAIWGRRLAYYNKKCVYWNNYDQPVI